jgi:hypothetical protein
VSASVADNELAELSSPEMPSQKPDIPVHVFCNIVLGVDTTAHKPACNYLPHRALSFGESLQGGVIVGQICRKIT